MCSRWAGLQFSCTISQFIIEAELSVIHFQYLEVSFWQNCIDVNEHIHIRGWAHAVAIKSLKPEDPLSNSDFGYWLKCLFPPEQMEEKALMTFLSYLCTLRDAIWVPCMLEYVLKRPCHLSTPLWPGRPWCPWLLLPQIPTIKTEVMTLWMSKMGWQGFAKQLLYLCQEN